MENITTDNFKTEVLESNIPVLVDFWAPWCGPCKMISPIIEEIAEEYKDKIKVVKVNVDEAPLIAKEYYIRHIPTVVMFKEGKMQQFNIGGSSKEAIITLINKVLN